MPRFQDFRVMFDKMGKQIDAVSVGVPDFAHFPITMMAIGLAFTYTWKNPWRAPSRKWSS